MTSPIVFARLRTDTSEAGAANSLVHAFAVHHHDDRGNRRTFCGIVMHESRLERADANVGTVCKLCFAVVPSDQLASHRMAAGPGPLRTSATEGGLYAIGLRGQLWHMLAANPVKTSFAGRYAVLCACGVIGFLTRAVPANYSPCPTCQPERRTT